MFSNIQSDREARRQLGGQCLWCNDAIHGPAEGFKGLYVPVLCNKYA